MRIRKRILQRQLTRIALRCRLCAHDLDGLAHLNPLAYANGHPQSRTLAAGAVRRASPKGNSR
jgi:hypothetical protein